MIQGAFLRKTIIDIFHKKLGTRAASRVVKQLKISDPRKLGNIRKMLDVGADAAWCPAFLPGIKL